MGSEGCASVSDRLDAVVAAWSARLWAKERGVVGNVPRPRGHLPVGGKADLRHVSRLFCRSKQEKVVNGIDKILNETKKLETIYSQKIDNLDELKKSILQKAFSGELTTMAK